MGHRHGGTWWTEAHLRVAAWLPRLVFKFLGAYQRISKSQLCVVESFFSELVNEIQAQAEHQQKQETVKHGNAGVQFLGNSKWRATAKCTNPKNQPRRYDVIWKGDASNPLLRSHLLQSSKSMACFCGDGWKVKFFKVGDRELELVEGSRWNFVGRVNQG